VHTRRWVVVDQVEFSGGADCEMLNAGAAAPTKIVSIAADGLSLTTDDDHPGASEVQPLFPLLHFSIDLFLQ
jgi:hypothetical protein